jgi:Holliday junction resolvase
MTEYDKARNHENKIINRFKQAGYVGIHSARSLRIDVIIFSTDGTVKLIECKRSSKNIYYMYPNDLKHLQRYWVKLGKLGHNAEMIVSLWFPKRRITREKTLDPKIVSDAIIQDIPIKFELKRKRLSCQLLNKKQ